MDTSLVPSVLLKALIGICIFVLFLYVWSCICRWKYGISWNAVVVGFMHPYCDAGGGGERVLWRILAALDQASKQQPRVLLKRPIHVVIYTGDNSSPKNILDKAQERFGIKLNEGVPITFVYLRTRCLLEAKWYPVLTLLGQAVGGVVVGGEALVRLVPHVWVDTTGLPSTLPLAAITGCTTAAYLHYPTISTDMLWSVATSRPGVVHNRAFIARSRILSCLKIGYYVAFAGLYGVMGAFADLVMVNSNWTRAHIDRLWWLRRWCRRGEVHVVFPPCGTEDLQKLPLHGPGGRREKVILSVGQFRPEKDHPLQLRAMAHFIKKYGGSGAGCGVRLVLVGGCRGPEDQQRVHHLKQLAQDLGLQDRVEFVLNARYEVLRGWLGRAALGLHTMWNEHFGICLVEYMAAGLVVVAHRSGGPLADIVQEGGGPGSSSTSSSSQLQTGFLAEAEEEYSEAMFRVFSQDMGTIRTNARESVSRFSEQTFDAHFIALFMPLIQNK